MIIKKNFINFIILIHQSVKLSTPHIASKLLEAEHHEISAKRQLRQNFSKTRALDHFS